MAFLAAVLAFVLFCSTGLAASTASNSFRAISIAVLRSLYIISLKFIGLIRSKIAAVIFLCLSFSLSSSSVTAAASLTALAILTSSGVLSSVNLYLLITTASTTAAASLVSKISFLVKATAGFSVTAAN